MSFYSVEELQQLGLASFGEDVRIAKNASIYNPGRISIGNHVRIGERKRDLLELEKQLLRRSDSGNLDKQ